MLNVVNTLRPDSIKGIVENLKAKRKNLTLDKEAIVMTSEFGRLWKVHKPIEIDQRKYGLAQLKTVNYDVCPICFMAIKH